MRINWTYILHRYSWRKGTASERRFIEIQFSLARTLRAKRRSRLLTQVQLAKRMGIAQQTISKVERASRHVTIDCFVRAMIALDATDAEIAAAFNAENDRGVQQLRARGRLHALKPRPERGSSEPPSASHTLDRTGYYPSVPGFVRKVQLE